MQGVLHGFISGASGALREDTLIFQEEIPNDVLMRMCGPVATRPLTRKFRSVTLLEGEGGSGWAKGSAVLVLVK